LYPEKQQKQRRQKLGFGELGLRHETGGGPSCGPDLPFVG